MAEVQYMIGKFIQFNYIPSVMVKGIKPRRALHCWKNCSKRDLIKKRVPYDLHCLEEQLSSMSSITLIFLVVHGW